MFRRLLPRLGYKSAVWAIAHRLCRLVWKILHGGIRYVEQGIGVEPKLLIYRAQSLAKQLRKFGYNVQITPANRRQHKTRERNPEEVIFDGVLSFIDTYPISRNFEVLSRAG